jgi:hypothetical protein
LQAPCPILVEGSARVEQVISDFLGFNRRIHFISRTYHISLLPLVSIAFRIIAIQVSYEHSKLAIEFDPSNRQCISESGNSNTKLAGGPGEAWKQIDSPWNSQSVRLKSR